MKRSIEKRLDVVFKRYIRRKETPNGWGNCVSCGANKPFEELHGGHFIGSPRRATRWREDNVHIQCVSCNTFNEGNKAGYGIYMVKRYGLEHVEYLNMLSKTTPKFTDSEGELLIEEYKKKLKALETGRSNN